MKLRFSIGANRFRFTFKFLILTTVLVALFCYLGFWQLERAKQKQLLMESYQHRSQEAPVDFPLLFDNSQDVRYHSIVVKGRFDNEHQIILDNKTQNGQVGYEIYTPVHVDGSRTGVLIDRGFVKASADRSQLPPIKPNSEALSLKGVVTNPPSYYALGKMDDQQNPDAVSYPLRVQFIDLKALSRLVGYELAPYVVWLDPASPLGFDRQWKLNVSGPEKNTLYAVQWFAFASCLLILFVALNIHRDEES